MDRSTPDDAMTDFVPDPDADLPGGPNSDQGAEVGRLVEPESGVDELDTTAEPLASDTGEDDDLSAEEAAMHIVPDR